MTCVTSITRMSCSGLVIGPSPAALHRGPGGARFADAARRPPSDGPIATVTFNRPEARNAMTWPMYDALVEFCGALESDAAVRVIVLRGAGGKAFVAGTDIGQFRTFRTEKDGVAYEHRIDAVVDRLERVAKPTIAAIDGVTTGGGCALAAACDLRVCTSRSRFGVPIARTLGNCLSAANHARFLDLIGPARLKEMLYTRPAVQCRGSGRCRSREPGGGAARPRHGRGRIRRDDGRERPADHPRQQGDDPSRAEPPPYRGEARPRPDRELLHERRLPRRCPRRSSTNARPAGQASEILS